MRHLKAEIEAAIRQWMVPGLAYAVIAGDEVVLAGGAGVRSAGTADAIDEHTIFAIGSVTKSFTGAAVAMLVDHGLLSWNDRVVDRLPKFRLYDPYVTRELTVRDLLTHRSGLARGDMLWYKSRYGSAEVLRRVRHLAPSWSLRSAFGYQNIMYLAAGELVREITGTPWERFVKERIFDPLGMSSSRADINDVDDRSNLAAPHAKLDGSVTSIDHHSDTNYRPAGSIYSSVADMAQWLRFQLGDGTHGKHRILSSASLQETQTPQMTIALAAPWNYMFPETDYLSYGLGWFVWNYRGRKAISHGGNIDGMSAQACVVPSERIGLVVLSNLDSTMLPNALLHRILDEILGKTAHVWLNEFYSVQETQAAQLEHTERELKSSRLFGTKPSRSPSAYAGVYEDAFYGRASIEQSGGDLHIDCIGFRGTLEHWHVDTFTFVPENPILRKFKPLVRFTVDDFGEVTRMTLRLIDGLELSFARASQPVQQVALSKQELAQFEGSFASTALPLTITVELLGEALKANLPGALAGEPDAARVAAALQPIGDDRFVLAPGPIIAGFARDDGAVTRLRIEAPHAMPLEFIKQN